MNIVISQRSNPPNYGSYYLVNDEIPERCISFSSLRAGSRSVTSYNIGLPFSDKGYYGKLGPQYDVLEY